MMQPPGRREDLQVMQHRTGRWAAFLCGMPSSGAKRLEPPFCISWTSITWILEQSLMLTSSSQSCTFKPFEQKFKYKFDNTNANSNRSMDSRTDVSKVCLFIILVTCKPWCQLGVVHSCPWNYYYSYCYAPMFINALYLCTHRCFTVYLYTVYTVSIV